jgi:biopolymer transport protein ExbB
MTKPSGLWRAGTWLVLTVVLILAIPAASRSVLAQSPSASTPSATEAKGSPAAKAQEIPFNDPLALMRRGGYMMWGIAACSIVMAAFFFERLIALRRSRIIPGPFVKRLLPQIREGQLDQEQAAALCKENGSPLARILGAAVGKWGRPAVEVEQAIVDAGDRATFGLRTNLRVFSAVHTLGPLLGLVGTSFGIIVAFNSLSTQVQADRAEQLANGVAQSLLNTAFGLMVAVPALLAYLWFQAKADRYVFEMDSLAQELVEMISAEALQGHKEESKVPAPKMRRTASARSEANAERS